MAYDPRVIRAISREATRRYGKGGYSKAERRKIRSAFATGIVESGLRNLSYGDSTSVGWRQETSSSYPNVNRRDVPASVARYFNEADKLYRGDTAASLAARVQRPAAAYVHRYGLPKNRAEAIRLLRKNVLGGSDMPNGGSGGQGGSGASVASQGLPAALTAPQVSSAPLSGIADPATSARRFLKMPEYGGDVPSSGPPSPDAPLSERLRSTAIPLSPQPLALGRGVPTPRALGTVVAGQGRTVRTEGGKTYKWNGRGWVLQGKLGGPGAPRDRGRFKNATYRAPYGTTYGAPRDRPGERTDPVLRRFTKRLAGKTKLPITFGTGSAHSRLTSSGNVSDHWIGRGIDLPASGARLTRMGAGALQLVGVSKKRAWQMARQGGIFNINYRGKRHQIIVNTTDHYDHLHVGIGY